MFKNRQHAGRLLAEKLSKALAARAPEGELVVVGLPRGGVPVAAEVATALAAPLTILVSKKIGAPGQPECAIGAVSSKGVVVISGTARADLPGMDSYLSRSANSLIEQTQTKEKHWLQAAGLDEISFAGRCCIIVDDGIATGMTAWAAVETMKRAGARSIILAAPVIAFSTRQALEKKCDAVVAVSEPTDLVAVGLYYFDFHQVEDDEMIEVLRSTVTEINQSHGVARRNLAS